MLELDVDLSDLVDVVEALEQAPEDFQRQFVPAIWESELLFAREAKERTPTHSNALRASIIAEPPETDASGIRGAVGTPLEYAVPVELGTRPHFPPVRAVTGEDEPLDDWVRDVLDIHDAERAEGVALAIARKIAARGTRGVFMFKEAADATARQIRAIHVRAARRFLEEVGR